MKNKNKENNKSGFTLLEALVAVSILMVAVMAPITIAQKGLSSATYTKNQMIASYLAQDAIEYIKNKRDEVSIGHNFDWDTLSYFSSCLDDNWCGIDTLGSDGSGFIQDDETAFLTKTNGNNFYGYANSDKTDTIFSRQINIKLNGDDEALIAVTVKWGEDENQLTVKTLIYNY